MCFCSKGVLLPVCRASAVMVWQRRLPAGCPKSHITEGLKSCSATHLWQQLNWWVRNYCYSATCFDRSYTFTPFNNKGNHNYIHSDEKSSFFLFHVGYNVIWNPEEGSLTRFLQCKGCLSQSSGPAAVVAAEVQYPSDATRDQVKFMEISAQCLFGFYCIWTKEEKKSRYTIESLRSQEQ